MGGKIITEVITLRPKTYAAADDDDDDDDGKDQKKANGTKKCNKTRICLKISKIVCPVIKMFIDHNKDLTAIIMMFIQKKLIKLH